MLPQASRIPKNDEPPQATLWLCGGSVAFELEAVTTYATKQPVHRKMVPSLTTEPATLRTVDSAFGHLARSTT